MYLKSFLRFFLCYFVNNYLSLQLNPLNSDDCVDPVLRTDNGGLIQSHKKFGISPYLNNMYCEWVIISPVDYQIMIQFDFLNLESDDYCQYDYIEFSSFFNQSIKICGDDESKRYISQQNRIRVRFYSDSSVNFEGFQLRYLFVLSSSVSQGTISTTKTNRICNDDEWKCIYVNTCIPKSWVCDNIRDCLDNSDEFNCVSSVSCQPSQIGCKSGQCISKEYWCNGITECEDNSDELNCTSKVPLPDPLKPSLKNECSFQSIVPIYINEDKDNPQIVGGRESIPGSWPWMALLLYNGKTFCGGSLLSDIWVVSAAHCFVLNSNPDYWTVDLGRYYFFNGKVQSLPVEKIILHPKFNIGTLDYDIALIKLKKKAILSISVQTVCLPGLGKEPVAGQKCVILGWGYTGNTGGEGVLKEAVIPIYDRMACKKLYNGIITDQMICAGYEKGGTDSCGGDSGGPLVCRIKEKFFLYGISSFGKGCALPNKPGIYTNVVNFIPWISNIVQELLNNTNNISPSKSSFLTTKYPDYTSKEKIINSRYTQGRRRRPGRRRNFRNYK